LCFTLLFFILPRACPGCGVETDVAAITDSTDLKEGESDAVNTEDIPENYYHLPIRAESAGMKLACEYNENGHLIRITAADIIG
jgi:YD repeat-containing protein